MYKIDSEQKLHFENKNQYNNYNKAYFLPRTHFNYYLQFSTADKRLRTLYSEERIQRWNLVTILNSNITKPNALNKSLQTFALKLPQHKYFQSQRMASFMHLSTPYGLTSFLYVTHAICTSVARKYVTIIKNTEIYEGLRNEVIQNTETQCDISDSSQTAHTTNAN